MLPTDIINYIIIHELCHVIEPNHSKNFWNLVRKFDPKFERKKEMVKKKRVLHNSILILIIVLSL